MCSALWITSSHHQVSLGSGSGSAEYGAPGQLGTLPETAGDSGPVVTQAEEAETPGGRGQSVVSMVSSTPGVYEETPPPLPPRYATIRKSYTLPHNMAGAAGGTEGRIYDNPNTMKQRQETGQPIYAATQPGHQGSLPKKAGGGVKALIRPRPSSLSVEKRQFLRSASQDASGRPVSSMSTFSCSSVTQPSTPASGTPSKRSRSLQVQKIKFIVYIFNLIRILTVERPGPGTTRWSPEKLAECEQR